MITAIAIALSWRPASAYADLESRLIRLPPLDVPAFATRAATAASTRPIDGSRFPKLVGTALVPGGHNLIQRAGTVVEQSGAGLRPYGFRSFAKSEAAFAPPPDRQPRSAARRRDCVGRWVDASQRLGDRLAQLDRCRHGERVAVGFAQLDLVGWASASSAEA